MTLRCGYCGEPLAPPAGAPPPQECPKCFSAVDASATQPSLACETQTSTNALLHLRYLKTGQCIAIPNGQRSVVGRGAVGAEIIANILQISREHCVITWQDGAPYVRDLGSSHGTFAGIDKRECLTGERPLENGALLFLGRECFEVLLVPQSADQAPPATTAASAQPEAPAHVVWRCHHCTHSGEARPEGGSCPSCGQYNE